MEERVILISKESSILFKFMKFIIEVIKQGNFYFKLFLEVLIFFLEC